MRAQKKIFLSASQMNCAKRGIVATTAETTLSTGGASRGLEQSHTGRLGEDLIWRSPETRFSQRCHDPCDISPGEQEDGERYIPWDDMPEGAAGLVCWRSWEADQSSGRRSRRRCEGKEVGITERKRDCSRCMCRWRRGGGGGGGGGGGCASTSTRQAKHGPTQACAPASRFFRQPSSRVDAGWISSWYSSRA